MDKPMTREVEQSSQKRALADALKVAWDKYVNLLGERPHGTVNQLRALAEFIDLDALLAAERERLVKRVAELEKLVDQYAPWAKGDQA